MKVKILIVDNSPGMTGAFRSILSVVQAMRNDIDFHFAIHTNATLHLQLDPLRIAYIRLPFLELRKNWKTIFYFPVLFLNSYRLYRYCKQNQIQMLHVNDLYNMTGILVKMMQPNAKLVYHVRLLRSSYAGLFYNLWLKMVSTRADIVIVVSQAVEAEVRNVIGHSVPIKLIYDFVPLPGIAVQQSINQTTNYLFPANYIAGKGHEYALESFANAFRKNPSIRLVMCGGDLGLKKNKALKHRLKEKVRALRLEGVISIDDSYPDLRSRLESSHAVLMFSQSESFSMICYEAMFYGMPVIASRCGGPSELIEDGVSGILVENGNTEEMESAILRLADNHTYRMKIGSQAAISIREHLTRHKAVERLMEVYTGEVTLNV